MDVVYRGGYDPFMGSGTTIAAAALLNRAGYGCELSPSYCDAILRRIMNLTGETPVLVETGEMFAAAGVECRMGRGDVARRVGVAEATDAQDNDLGFEMSPLEQYRPVPSHHRRVSDCLLPACNTSLGSITRSGFVGQESAGLRSPDGPTVG